jgi:nitrite reductase/ring-hydroxylating ferredoxin subunit
VLTQQENELFTRVGPGTPMGNVLRRYWHPVGSTELVTWKPQRVTGLGEELLLYRASDQSVVLMDLRCAHRRVAMDFGRVENDCIRCPYHGWLYDRSGQVTYQWDRKPYGVDNVMNIEGIDDTHTSCFGFPTVNRFSMPAVEPGGELVRAMIFRVPIDDLSIRQYFVRFYPSETRAFRTRTRDPKPGVYAPLPNDWWGIDVFDQDRMAIEQQGVIADRTKERLGASDGGIILMRKMMHEALAALEAGIDPPCIIRDPAKQMVDFPQRSMMLVERSSDADYSMAGGSLTGTR